VENLTDTRGEEQSASTTAPRPVMELVGISKAFGGAPALTDVSLTIREGEVHALLGENGAGKSTLMNIASGALAPDSGTIVIDGAEFAAMTPSTAAGLGIAIVHQHPAVIADLSVLENLLVALPATVFAGGSKRLTAQRLLERVSLKVHLDERVERLTVAERHLLEIAKALAVAPRVLVLDEPTAPLGSEAVELLFRLVRDAVGAGTAVVYITHRMGEVRDLAQRVTVLRDGRVAQSSIDIDAVSDDELLALIVGRRLSSTFPPKANREADEAPNLVIDGLSGPGFHDVNLTARPGEIIGIAGVVGNGQTELVRALAGLSDHSGTITLGGRKRSSSELLRAAAYMPADRHHDGLLMRFSVRENTAISSLTRFLVGPFLSRRREAEVVSRSLASLSVKASSLDAPVSSLSGGNQQKVVMARTVLSDPILVIADEPTQGVDVGARAEIYDILRGISAAGTPVVVASSDAKELEGLCDKVIVMSRGRVILELDGDDVDEDRMIHTAVSARTESIATATRRRESSRLDRILNGEMPPIALLTAVIVALGLFVLSHNGNYLNAFNINAMLISATALGFIALGQTVIMLLGGIDLSVGPLAGLIVVISSFFLTEGAALPSMLLGLAAMILTALVVGLINGSLIRFARFTAIAATLAMYIALQGVSFILRPQVGGSIDRGLIDVIGASIGPVPVVFLVLVVVGVALEICLRRTRWGWTLRAVGSDEPNARRIGVKINATVVGGFVAGSLLTLLGALILMQQLGVGDAAQGIGYTLTGITAVVLGGTSIFGGRGTFIGTLLGGILLVQVINATVFLRLDQMWQYFLQGLLILVAMLAYGFIRPRRRSGTS
jgi:ribose transport system ATP-binding protein